MSNARININYSALFCSGHLPIVSIDHPNAMVEVKNKVCLIVHDGWGIAPEKGMKGDAIDAGITTNMDTIAKEHSHRTLHAHGIAVGLSDGLMGNSEVGHLNIGAGRIVWQDIVRIDVSIKKRQFHKNKHIVESCKRAKEGNGRLHLLGLVSDGGVHSHINHLYALIETAKEVGVPHVYIHFFGDGRDTAPRSAAGYLKDLLAFIDKEKYGEVATVIGRYYAMDRDKRWERIKVAVDGLVKAGGQKGEDPVAAIEECYKKDETDEFLKPIIVNGRRAGSRMGIHSDGGRLPKDLNITTMSQYNAEFPFAVAFPPQAMTNVLAEWLSKEASSRPMSLRPKNTRMSRFFFNGGVEKQFTAEERFMIPSPKVATYDKDPKMSVQSVADKVAELVKKGEYEFIMCNFAPPDMVGHTGVFDAAVEAITRTDAAVGTVYKACEEAGYILLITADHGNAEQMINPETGAPHTAHTTNPKDGEEEEGALCDVAPTVLDILGLPKPEEMSGRSLLAKSK
ncbi:2,3-bisphosphoglycerate-independent phosphoglycerate mutase [Grifola frondosa]|uniref:phosphoglycerate mutase (2,3-diphosphoglycerate-independent) n=1 Tax=Grifola frondosa TaxID=5627 RepID=A0A1C7LVM2_GRIFR|nr:2,3-bisphosphoglycerate-independent phosphoglycerate mutase [Grifola frondosa]